MIFFYINTECARGRGGVTPAGGGGWPPARGGFGKSIPLRLFVSLTPDATRDPEITSDNKSNVKWDIADPEAFTPSVYI